VRSQSPKGRRLGIASPGAPRSGTLCPMRTVTSLPAMQQKARRWRREGVEIGLVPTMGYLHDGHASLIREARRRVRRRGRVVVSLFVNPTQFAPHEDLGKYPRDFARDAALCRAEGVDVLFAPTNAEMYAAAPGSPHSTFVVEEGLSRSMEGTSRPAHFRGVATVVAKLFNLVLPDVAVFGAKDWQQAAVVRRLVRDLNFPIEIVVAPTVREPDGLALSSRNQYLSPEERLQATVLWRSIEMARQAVRASSRSLAPSSLERRIARLVASAPAARLDYVACFDSETLQPVCRVTLGTHLALAVFVGTTRLIDNARLE